MKSARTPSTTRTAKRGRAPAAATVPPLLKLNRILVPVDLSEASLNALHYALPFAKLFGAEITLLHVVTPPVYPQEFGYTGLTEVEQSTDAKRRLDRMAKAQIPKGIKLVKLVSIGIASAEIVETAKTSQIDLIIATTHGYTGLKHVLLGSTAERVIRHAPCPVLVVRDREHEMVD